MSLKECDMQKRLEGWKIDMYFGKLCGMKSQKL